MFSRPMTNEVTEYMKQHVSNTKHLTGGIIFLDAIPKNLVCRYINHAYTHIVAYR